MASDRMFEVPRHIDSVRKLNTPKPLSMGYHLFKTEAEAKAFIIERAAKDLAAAKEDVKRLHTRYLRCVRRLGEK